VFGGLQLKINAALLPPNLRKRSLELNKRVRLSAVFQKALLATALNIDNVVTTERHQRFQERLIQLHHGEHLE
jgi:hypothetical protein